MAKNKMFKGLLKRINLRVMKYSAYNKLKMNKACAANLRLLQTLPHEQAPNVLKYLSLSKSHNQQDLFALSQLDFKKEGYFVDFGATDGVGSSNSHLLEKELGWTGILAEPARCWHQALKSNRQAHIETQCVWKDSDSSLTFNEADNPGLSTVDTLSNLDYHRKNRKSGKRYTLQTISLTDMLNKYDAPKEIDYLSIDTEGSEFDILNAFDFDQYSFKVITCEHNFSPMRDKIFDLLTKNGYIRKYQDISRWDDWYVKEG